MQNKLLACLLGAFASILLAFFSGFVPASAAAQNNDPDSIQQAMYFHGTIQDAPGCDLLVSSDAGSVKIDFPANIASPALTCPDAFAWKNFLETINAEFWRNWATDETIWPTAPLPLCAEAESGEDCCTPGELTKPERVGGPAETCPYYPEDFERGAEELYVAANPISSHNNVFLTELDPARVIRQEEAEVVFRNRPMYDYIYQRGLYYREGLGKIYEQVSQNAAKNAPYSKPGLAVRFPTDAVMFKVDFAPLQVMQDMDLVSDHDSNPATPPQNPEAPYITILMETTTDEGKTYKEGYYYLLAVTAASKAIPNWHWYAIEHVANPGRCDYIGCNDSFGYRSSVTAPSGEKFNSNFIQPHTQDDGLGSSSVIFDRGKPYPSGDITSSLQRVMNGLNIGTSDSQNPRVPSPSDRAWRSYRLKGTQTQFVSSVGMPTLMGASITEGGFVNSASCLTCHAQASVDKTGNFAVPGVGSNWLLNQTGYNQSVNGPPDPNWFIQAGTTNFQAVQIDFVWGILNAQCAYRDAQGNCTPRK